MTCKCEPLRLSHNYAEFDADRSCGSRYITFSFCQVTSSDNIIKRACNLLGGSPSTQVTALPSLMLIGLAKVKI